MNNTEFKKIVGETLKKQGFKYRNKQYYFENDDLIIFLAFQKSNFDNSFYINYGFFLKALHEKVEKLSHGFGDFGGRFIFNQQDSYHLDTITPDALRTSVRDNVRTFIRPAFDNGLATYFEIYPHFKHLCGKSVKKYLDL